MIKGREVGRGGLAFAQPLHLEGEAPRGADADARTTAFHGADHYLDTLGAQHPRQLEFTAILHGLEPEYVSFLANANV
ncbi:hypothetical protein D3C80_2061090 [compost metagenome]